MFSKIQNYRVNWVNGMKISEKNFIAAENYLSEFITNATSISLDSTNYGCLYEPDLQFSTEAQVVSLYLRKCIAVSQSGFIFNIIPEFNVKIKIPFTEIQSQVFSTDSQSFYIVVSAYPEVRHPFGKPIELGSNLWYPNVRMDYRLNFISVAANNLSTEGLHSLIIGKFTTHTAQVEVDGKTIQTIRVSADDNYIPPCTKLTNHPRLYERATQLTSLLVSLENSCMAITKKLNIKEDSMGITPNQKSIRGLVNTLTTAIVHQLPMYNLHKQQVRPIELTITYSILSKAFLTHIRGLSEQNLKDLLDYFESWKSTLSPSNLQSSLENCILAEYDHCEIANRLNIIYTLWQNIENLFDTITEHDPIGVKYTGVSITGGGR